jgi:hypothetical protein
MKKIIFLFSFCLIATISFGHEYHVAIINIDHNKDSSSLEITLKVNTKDLNSVLRDLYKKNPELNTTNELKHTDSLLNIYLRQNMKIKVDSIEKQMNYIGYEHEEEFTYIYIEYKNINQVNILFINCTLLGEVGLSDHGHSHQSNLINVKANGKTKSLYLNPHNREATIEF